MIGREFEGNKICVLSLVFVQILTNCCFECDFPYFPISVAGNVVCKLFVTSKSIKRTRVRKIPSLRSKLAYFSHRPFSYLFSPRNKVTDNHDTTPERDAALYIPKSRLFVLDYRLSSPFSLFSFPKVAPAEASFSRIYSRQV